MCVCVCVCVCACACVHACMCVCYIPASITDEAVLMVHASKRRDDITFHILAAHMASRSKLLLKVISTVELLSVEEEPGCLEWLFANCQTEKNRKENCQLSKRYVHFSWTWAIGVLQRLQFAMTSNKQHFYLSLLIVMGCL